MKYKAILFHPEGDFVTDFRSNEKREIWDNLCEMGSKWIFYPIALIGTDKKIVDVPEGAEYLKNRNIKTVQKAMRKFWEEHADNICKILNDGGDYIYFHLLENYFKR